VRVKASSSFSKRADMATARLRRSTDRCSNSFNNAASSWRPRLTAVVADSALAAFAAATRAAFALAFSAAISDAFRFDAAAGGEETRGPVLPAAVIVNTEPS
jgi:hypothetical protein